MPIIYVKGTKQNRKYKRLKKNITLPEFGLPSIAKIPHIHNQYIDNH
jgi:hypothetical protein